MIYSLFVIQVKDSWELNRDDVKLLKNEPLGEGTFGEVYKAILQPKSLSSQMKLEKRQMSTSDVVAVKMLKGLPIDKKTLHNLVVVLIHCEMS